MKKIENKELELELVKYNQNASGKRLEVVSHSTNTTTLDLLLQIVKTPHAQNGLGDLEEQSLRLKVLGKIKDGISKLAKDKAKKSPKSPLVLELEDEEAKLLKSNIKNVQYLILDEGLIAFQQEVNKW